MKRSRSLSPIRLRRPPAILPKVKRRRHTVSTPRKWKVKAFEMQTKWFQEFKRHLPHPTDCVIDVMEFLKIITPRDAAIMRAMTTNRDGITQESIVTIFQYLYSRYEWRFQGYYSTTKLTDLFINLPRGSAAFGGFIYTINGQTNNHAVIYAKTIDDKLWLLDPQQSFVCEVGSSICNEYFSHVIGYYALEYR
jgi:hypothetical protein